MNMTLSGGLVSASQKQQRFDFFTAISMYCGSNHDASVCPAHPPLLGSRSLPSAIEALCAQSGKAADRFVTVPSLRVLLGTLRQRSQPLGTVAFGFREGCPERLFAEPEGGKRITGARTIVAKSSRVTSTSDIATRKAAVKSLRGRWDSAPMAACFCFIVHRSGSSGRAMTARKSMSMPPSGNSIEDDDRDSPVSRISIPGWALVRTTILRRSSG
jgi:hypothetical protein